MDERINLEMVHFQITKSCNLRCYFCGQWGNKGFFANDNGKEMTLNDWKNVTEDLIKAKKERENLPKITLWGGEPLTCSFFDELVEYLFTKGFRLSIVTNGVLIDRHLDTIKKYIKNIFISIDGTKELHNSIRGQGVYEKVEDNIRKIKSSDNRITVMSVLTPDLVSQLNEHLNKLNTFGIDRLILQDYIYLSNEEISSYKKMMVSEFNINTCYIDSWESSFDEKFFEAKNNAVKNIDENLYDYRIKYLPHEKSEKYCKSPFHHAHITWNGNVNYCTDFYDFFAGNVKNENIFNIINNEKSEKFRQIIFNKKCVTCNHCSWLHSEHF